MPVFASVNATGAEAMTFCDPVASVVGLVGWLLSQATTATRSAIVPHTCGYFGFMVSYRNKSRVKANRFLIQSCRDKGLGDLPTAVRETQGYGVRIPPSRNIRAYRGRIPIAGVSHMRRATV